MNDKHHKSAEIKQNLTENKSTKIKARTVKETKTALKKINS